MRNPGNIWLYKRERDEGQEYDATWMVVVVTFLEESPERLASRRRAEQRTMRGSMVTIRPRPQISHFYGPFDTEEDALEWGETWATGKKWAALPLYHPDIEMF